MSVGRAIGWIGLAILAGGAVFIGVEAWTNRDWYDLLMTALVIGLLAFFGYMLAAAARREADPELAARSGLGWHGESVTAFLRGPVLHTPEGLVALGASAAAVLFALLAWFAPGLVGLNPARSAVNATLFAVWPLLLFLIYVRWSSPHFEPRVLTLVVVLCVAVFPFYLAYR